MYDFIVSVIGAFVIFFVIRSRFFHISVGVLFAVGSLYLIVTGDLSASERAFGVIYLCAAVAGLVSRITRKHEVAEIERQIESENERINREELEKHKEQERHFRDSESQDSPCTYRIGRHAGETLAIRYGIAHQRNGAPKETIRLQKTKKIAEGLYEVLLSDYRNRKAKAIIEVGTEYVKTFYPLDDDWFDRFSDLETTLKGNSGFSLKELANFHVDKVVMRK